MAVSVTRLQLVGSATSATDNVPPARPTAAAHAPSMSTARIFEPPRASRSVSARPIPEPPPVTTALRGRANSVLPLHALERRSGDLDALRGDLEARKARDQAGAASPRELQRRREPTER